MMKRFLSGIIAVLTLFSIAYAEQLPIEDAPVNTVRIVSVKPATDGIYAVISVEYPKSWSDDVKFTVEVNGRATRIRKISGGFSSDKNVADFIFFPKRAGNQKITVKAVMHGKSVQAKGNFDWKQISFIAIMGHTGDREILMTKDKLTIAIANVIDVRISFNGKDVYGKLSGSDIQTRSLDPAWRQGKNVLTVSGYKLDGNIIVKNFTLFYVGEDGYIPLGETAILCYGKEGSKSGPFYDVKIEGDILAPLRDVRVNYLSMDRDGWLVSDTMLAKEFRAQKPGIATIRIFIKPHFLEEMKLDKELAIKVSQP